jgi:hypothetical protein
MKGLDVGHGVLVTGLTSAGAGSINNSTGVDGVVGVKSCAKRKRNFSQFTTALASRDTIRSKSYRMVCSNAQPEESGNKDYDDHDADDVKNVHCTLRSRHARLQVKARCSHRKHFETILSSGVRETIKSVRLDHRELVPSACHRHQGTSRSRRQQLALRQLFLHQHR